MRLLVQRVRYAEVKIEGRSICAIAKGIVVFVGIRKGDTRKDVEYLSGKLSGLRIFEDNVGKVNLSPLEIDAEVMIVSQFTLYGDTRRGRRPDFSEAAPQEVARGLYDEFTKSLASYGLRVKSGVFGERMEVIIHNDGPFTIIMDSRR
jgi:D-tyrosyl-tRNA(Tyr) deacylase